MKKIRTILADFFPWLKLLVLYYNAIKSKPGLPLKIMLLINFISDEKRYRQINQNKNFKLVKKYLKPCLFDKIKNTPVDTVYFYQDSWCAKKIFESNPAHHYDIGSKAEMIGIISQFTPTTMIDIRPITLKLNGLNFVNASILALPFKNDSLDSISSICVIEHIGLGRYGDKLDAFGSEKAASELIRVLAPGGNLYISLPVDEDNLIYFNAHRAFTREYILEIFKPLSLIEEKYIYKIGLTSHYNPERGFGTGLFHFRKNG